MYGKANKAINLTKVSLNTLNLANKKIVVVGGTDGLGRSIARQCSETHRADVSVVGRTNREESTSKIKFLKADLSLVTEAERIASKYTSSLSRIQSTIVYKRDMGTVIPVLVLYPRIRIR